MVTDSSLLGVGVPVYSPAFAGRVNADGYSNKKCIIVVTRLDNANFALCVLSSCRWSALQKK